MVAADLPGRLRCGPVRIRAGVTLAILAAALLAACAEPAYRGELYYTRDDQHEIADPSRTHAMATGIGCGGTVHEAEIAARRISTYNLRSLTGSARYTVEHRKLRSFLQGARICVEVEARAHP